MQCSIVLCCSKVREEFYIAMTTDRVSNSTFSGSTPKLSGTLKILKDPKE
jgi:hypothetical protein